MKFSLSVLVNTTSENENPKRLFLKREEALSVTQYFSARV